MIPFQVSILRVLHQMLSDAAFRKQPGSFEVLGFAAMTVRHVLAKLIPAEADAQKQQPEASHDGKRLHLQTIWYTIKFRQV